MLLLMPKSSPAKRQSRYHQLSTKKSILDISHLGSVTENTSTISWIKQSWPQAVSKLCDHHSKDVAASSVLLRLKTTRNDSMCLMGNAGPSVFGWFS